ncbi:MAG: hypothetical protein UY21_C0002G0004 [Microgenomates group bacterium GW2011_GWA1_48_10]|nr:MAG: hypothetical protein UY21_C0002G0004 [Microgenomates group bacterium GW2011_GWA1_48_10]
MKRTLIVILLLVFLFLQAPHSYADSGIVSPGTQATVQQQNYGTWFAPSLDSYLRDTWGSFGTSDKAGTGTQDGQDTGRGSRESDVNAAKWASMMVSYDGFALGCLSAQCGSVANGAPLGASGFFARGIDAMMTNRPASSIEYIAYLGNKLHVPGTPNVAYAADGGLGFTRLSPILPIWTVTRNLAYLVFAVVFIVIGVMIMTRQKIDPKTVASVQNALPKVIMALILVTFSYAIAGFLIDIMYVALALVVTLAGSISPSIADHGKTILSKNIFATVFDITGFFNITGGVFGAVQNITASFLGPGGGTVLQGTPAEQAGKTGIGAIAFVVVAIALLIAVFRTWLALLGAYANIILGVIFAPLRLMMDAIPGQNQFSAWLRDMVANLLAFPLVLILILIGEIIIQAGHDTTGGFAPPLIGGSDLTEMAAIVGLGILLTIPKAVSILQEALKTPPFKFGSAWMESMQPPANTTRGFVAGGLPFLTTQPSGARRAILQGLASVIAPGRR